MCEEEIFGCLIQVCSTKDVKLMVGPPFFIITQLDTSFTSYFGVGDFTLSRARNIYSYIRKIINAQVHLK